MGWARFGDRVARDVVDVRSDLDGLNVGFWVVVATFEGEVTAVRFGEVRPAPSGPEPSAWAPLTGPWSTSLDETAYVRAVDEVRRRIAAGTVYQVNVCRVLSHPLADEASVGDLGAVLAQGNPAPHAMTVIVPEAGLEVACASPEAYLLRSGERIESRPVKGTAPTVEEMLPKDFAENLMIVDLVRNDLSHVCRPGTVAVGRLCGVEVHPGLVHLVSDVSGTLRPGVSWAELLASTFPPGSVSGAPKSTALEAIADLEPMPRGPYCGAIGWVDADAGEAGLAVGIRTFWAERDGSGRRWLRFGTGSGITWGSDPVGEWRETQLKAARLVGLACDGVAVTPGTLV